MSFNERDFEQLIGKTLRFGVLSGLALALLSIAIFIGEHGQEVLDYRIFKETAGQFKGFYFLWAEIASGKSRSMMLLATLFFIATPIARVLACLILFIWQRDLLYVCISAFVLAILVASFVF